MPDVRRFTVEELARGIAIGGPDLTNPAAVQLVWASDYDRDMQAFASQLAEARTELNECEHCQECGKAYAAVYGVPDDMWARICSRAPAGLFCPTCAIRKICEQYDTLQRRVEELNKEVDRLVQFGSVKQAARIVACREALNILVNAIGSYLFDDFYGCCIFCEKNIEEEPRHKETCPYQIADRALAQEGKG